uniref:transmembrane protein 106B-like isoform X2 n=1 Tax=Myxine glutinosa TaxID=7769 RepID=UPI00358E952A
MPHEATPTSLPGMGTCNSSQKDVLLSISNSSEPDYNSFEDKKSFLSSKRGWRSDHVTCPLCQGVGRIPTAQASEHVAIFSNHNGQFQPEKVKIYIALSIIISLLTSTLLFFFIFPRSVVLRKATVKQYAVSITGNSKTVFAKIIMSLTVENENFYTAHVMSTKTDVMLGKYVIGSYTDEQKRPVTAIGHQQFDVILEVNLDDFYQYCASSAIKVHNLLVNVRIMIVTKVIGTTDTSYIEMFQLIRCGMNATYNLQSSI